MSSSNTVKSASKPSASTPFVFSPTIRAGVSVIIRTASQIGQTCLYIFRTSRGERIIKLSYTERSVSEPLISSLTQKFGILLNIIFADVDIVQGAPIGGTVAIVSGEQASIEAAIQYLASKNVSVEVLQSA